MVLSALQTDHAPCAESQQGVRHQHCSCAVLTDLADNAFWRLRYPQCAPVQYWTHCAALTCCRQADRCSSQKKIAVDVWVQALKCCGAECIPELDAAAAVPRADQVGPWAVGCRQKQEPHQLAAGAHQSSVATHHAVLARRCLCCSTQWACYTARVPGPAASQQHELADLPDIGLRAGARLALACSS